ncbi:MAG: Peptide deformylase [Berkelbacteria bacterium GW2011_GWB1_38_5]|uniref:Multifunctional fusion protein n=2 Tax=Candidatus Berkelbacteria TaxID=1618330 RepID=A0A0G0PM79_9BACT|nr:MAG: Peptide deformylase [Berkelbacteria bacterium GW2011_GWB1_38_5]KKQ90416.1 MAG: Peptide deformylase [Berkelbacteria bacterium GW2011_GWA1_39_10]
MKKLLPITTVPDNKLNEVTKKVTSFDIDLQNQIRQMVDTLRSDKNGIGLSANQVGFDNQVCIVEFVESKEKISIPLQVFINPRIIEQSQECETLVEGCLSVPQIELSVERSVKLKLKVQNEKGKIKKLTAKGILARILQHELDHLNGIIFTNRIKEKLFSTNPNLKNIKIAFFGSGDFAATILKGLILLDFNMEIFTEIAKPVGRSKELKPTAVGQLALDFQKKFVEVNNINQLNFPQFDLIITADFGKKIPDAILKSAKIAAINIHPSLLPKYRGATPIQSVILNGEKETGISIIKMTSKIDQGPILAQITTEILPNENSITLKKRLSTLGLSLLIEILPDIVSFKIAEKNQDESKATLTKKIVKEDGKINWQKSPTQIDRQIRAFYGWPKAFTFINNLRLIIHTAHLKDKKLVFDIVQIEGKKPMTFKDFMKGFKGQKLDWFNKLKLE